MPELPEVETTRRGIAPHIENQKVASVIVRQHQLRWPVSAELATVLPGLKIVRVSRRAKYLLLETTKGQIIIHLGMSGNLRIVDKAEALLKHDHVDFVFGNQKILRFHDPRKFGCILWDPFQPEPVIHPLLEKLGPEPLSDEFTGTFLFKRSRKRNVPIKTFIMDGHVVVGVGNIYANEALFSAGIAPTRKAGNLSAKRLACLTAEIKQILARAIEVGGTTLRDFIGGDGKPGYFKQSLNVYGRGGLPCVSCGTILTEIRLGQRSTVYCKKCQS